MLFGSVVMFCEHRAQVEFQKQQRSYSCLGAGASGSDSDPATGDDINKSSKNTETVWSTLDLNLQS